MSFFDYPTDVASEPENVEYFLGDATEREWEIVLAHARARSFVVGDTVISPEAPERSLFLVSSGSLEILVPHRRRLRRIATVGAGSVLGELSFFDGRARSAVVRALTATELAELGRRDFDALAAAEPDLGRRMLFDLGRILAHRLRVTLDSSSVTGAP